MLSSRAGVWGRCDIKPVISQLQDGFVNICPKILSVYVSLSNGHQPNKCAQSKSKLTARWRPCDATERSGTSGDDFINCCQPHRIINNPQVSLQNVCKTLKHLSAQCFDARQLRFQPQQAAKKGRTEWVFLSVTSRWAQWSIKLINNFKNLRSMQLIRNTNNNNNNNS